MEAWRLLTVRTWVWVDEKVEYIELIGAMLFLYVIQYEKVKVFFFNRIFWSLFCEWLRVHFFFLFFSFCSFFIFRSFLLSSPLRACVWWGWKSACWQPKRGMADFLRCASTVTLDPSTTVIVRVAFPEFSIIKSVRVCAFFPPFPHLSASFGSPFVSPLHCVIVCFGFFLLSWQIVRKEPSDWRNQIGLPRKL